MAAGSREGVLRTVVPAAPDAWITALESYGTMSFGDCAAAAIRFASRGLPDVRADVRHDRDARRTTIDAGRRTPRSICRTASPRAEARSSSRPTSAARCSTWRIRRRPRPRTAAPPGSKAARDAFYRGDIARTIVAYHQREWRTDDGAGHGRVPRRRRAAGQVALRRSRRLRLRAVVPGTGAAADARRARGLRSQGHGAQFARLCACGDRGDEARVRRPRALLRRPAFRRRADRNAPFRRPTRERRRAMLRPDVAWPELPPSRRDPRLRASPGSAARCR